MNKKVLKLLLVFVALFTITLSVKAIDPNNYVTGENTQQAPEQTETPDETQQNEYVHTSIKEEKNGNKIIIEDDAKLLNDDQIHKLKDKMEPLTEYGHIAFKTIDSNSTTTAYYAEDYYHSNFNQESGTLLLIDMDNREIYIFSDGANYNIITKGKAYIITDNIYKYATNKDYYTCATVAFDQINTLLDGGKILEPMRYASNVVIAIVLAFFINFFIVVGVSKVKKAKANEVLNTCDIEFQISNVVGTRTGTHRKYSPISESSGSSHSGGGGFSGGGGGGGHSGGGGGHSF